MEEDLGSPTRVHCEQNDDGFHNYSCNVVYTTQDNRQVDVHGFYMDPSSERGIQKIRYVDGPARGSQSGATIDMQNMDCHIEEDYDEGRQLKCSA